MVITIGMFTYMLVTSCAKGGGYTAYPLDDDKSNKPRIISICTDYGPEQTSEEYIHEVIHACMHNHKHSFTNAVDLQEHLSVIPEQTEEMLVTHLAACMAPALENPDAIKFLGISTDDNN